MCVCVCVCVCTQVDTEYFTMSATGVMRVKKGVQVGTGVVDAHQADRAQVISLAARYLQPSARA